MITTLCKWLMPTTSWGFHESVEKLRDVLWTGNSPWGHELRLGIVWNDFSGEHYPWCALIWALKLPKHYKLKYPWISDCSINPSVASGNTIWGSQDICIWSKESIRSDINQTRAHVEPNAIHQLWSKSTQAWKISNWLLITQELAFWTKRLPLSHYSHSRWKSSKSTTTAKQALRNLIFLKIVNTVALWCFQNTDLFVWLVWHGNTWPNNSASLGRDFLFMNNKRPDKNKPRKP